MHQNIIKKYCFIILYLLIAGCSPKEPTYVYIPSSDFKESLEVWVVDYKDEAKTNEWLSLKATRKTGPWVRVKKVQISKDTRWLRNPPPEIEQNVQSNVRWNVEPKGYSTFNLPNANNLFERKIKFTKPGKYKLWATSHSWHEAPFDSNVIEITIK